MTTHVASSTAGGKPRTFCNPLPIPNYPIGRDARSIKLGDDTGGSWLWLSKTKQQYRELADPSVLWHDSKWYLYPSVDMAWVSDNGGATWQHHRLNVPDIGYAPTIEKHRGKFLLLASLSELYISPSPLGPFRSLGPITLPKGTKAPEQIDPMLFSDDDGRLFYYWGCSKIDGIWAVELDAESPTTVIGEPQKVIAFQPDKHPWERVGNWNENPNVSWIEGAWMLKRHGRYYLTYSAGGTENRTYAMGCYIGDSPLGPFTPQQRNPIFLSPHGLVTGTGHGCFVAGPDESLWVFYTIRASHAHGFERRIGMDRAQFDSNGELFVPPATSIPQLIHQPGNAGWLPLNIGKRTIGSTSAPNLPGFFAVDETLHTRWQPAADDPVPTLTTSFNTLANVHAVRIIWHDAGLDTQRGVNPGPFQYRVEVETTAEQWITVLDRTRSDEDLLIDYREVLPTAGTRARLIITGWPKGITPAVVDFTVFGVIPRIQNSA